MTAETYLRRALLAPIIVPLLVVIPWFIGGEGSRQVGGMAEITNYMATFLSYSVIAGGIPYVWMLWAKRDDLRPMTGRHLEKALQTLPLAMLPYFWKFWGAITLMLIPTGYGMLAGLGILVFGTVAVIILGYVYVAVTFAFLRGFQWLRLVAR